jgi:hypothetical protein
MKEAGVNQIVAFNDQERVLVASCRAVLEEQHKQLAQYLDDRVADLHSLAGIITRSASLVSDLGFSKSRRDLNTLAAKLVNQGVEEVVNLPVRASIGRTFMVAKLHLFGFLLNVVAKQGYLSDEQEEEILSCYHSILFALMAEDLYITIISDANGQESWAKRATHDLVMMWEKRSAVSTIAFAPLLQELWDARHLLIPVLGTLMGTVELLQLSMGLSRTWHDFFAAHGQEEQTVLALNEFLFSLSYEQIIALEGLMKQEGYEVVSREGAQDLLQLKPAQRLEGRNEEERSAVRLYRSFLRRNTLAKVRRDSERPGPRSTLEQQFMLYLWSIEH